MNQERNSGPNSQPEEPTDTQSTVRAEDGPSGPVVAQSTTQAEDWPYGPVVAQSTTQAEDWPYGPVFAQISDVGRMRPHNEDYVDVYVPDDAETLSAKGILYLVADGMGGHQAGEVASQEAVQAAIYEYYAATDKDIASSLVHALRAANEAVYEQARTDAAKAGMGTTLVAAAVLGQRAYIANVGDSRAYLIGRKGIRQITDDHSWVGGQVRVGLLTPEQARRHPQRNLVTRALGSKPTVDVDLFQEQLQEGEALLLCSDGLTGLVEDPEIEALVSEYPPEEAVQALVDAANERGGNDNISALLVYGGRGLIPAVVAGAARPWGFPLILIVVGVAALLALLIAGLVLVPPLLEATPNPAPTMSPTLLPMLPNTPALAPSLAPTLTASPTLAATFGLTGALLQSSSVPSTSTVVLIGTIEGGLAAGGTVG